MHEISKDCYVLLGDAIRERRTKLGLTLKELSERTGLAISTLSTYEHQPRQVDYKTVKSISTALGCLSSSIIKEIQTKGGTLEFNARNASNGIILKDAEDNEILFQEDDVESEAQNWADFLRFLTDHYGPSAGEYSPERVYITVAPGFDHADSDGKYSWETLCCPLCDRIPQDGEL